MGLLAAVLLCVPSERTTITSSASVYNSWSKNYYFLHSNPSGTHCLSIPLDPSKLPPRKEKEAVLQMHNPNLSKAEDKLLVSMHPRLRK